MKMKQTFLMFMFLLAMGSFTFGQSASATYNLGDIEADPFYLGGPGQTSNCPGTLTVTIPVGATITGVDVEYDYESMDPYYNAEQRSKLKCVSPGGTEEANVATSPNWWYGVWSYSRTGLTIANGVTTGGDVEFELLAGFDNLAAFECGVDYHKVNDGTWTVTVYYLDPNAPVAASNPNPADEATEVSIAAGMLTWDFGALTDSYDVYFGTDNPPTTKVVDDMATGGASTGSYSYGALAGSSVYFWQIVSRNTQPLETAGPIWRFSTECLAVSVPLTENFDSYTFPQWGDPSGYHGLTPLCWSVLSQSVYAYANMGWYSQPFNNYSTPNVFMASSEDDANAWAMMITPPMADPISTLQISFFAKTNSGTTPPLSVGTMSDPTDEATYTELTTVAISTTWTEYEVPMTSYVGSDTYIAVKYAANAPFAYQYVYIDNVSIITAPTCPKPKNLTAGNITSGSANLSWFEQGIATTWNIEYGLSGFTPTGTPSFSTTTNPYTLTGLNPNTAYDFYVQSDCGGGDVSVWSAGYTFQTACVAVSLPITENFDASTNLPDCWNIAQTANNYWSITGNNPPVSLPNYFLFYNNSNADKIALVSPMPDVTSISELKVNFFARHAWQEGFLLEVGTMSDPFDIATFTVLETVVISATSWTEHEIWFNNYTGTDGYIAFSPSSTQTYQYIWMDDITIDYLPTCLNPIDLTVDELNLTDAKLHWTESATATEWTIEVGLPGFTPGIGAYSQTYENITPAEYNYVMTGLASGTYYDVYIKAICDAGVDESEWSDVAKFHTAFDYFAGLPVEEHYEPDFDVTGNIPSNTANWTIESTLQNNGANCVRNIYGANNENVLLLYGKFDFTFDTQVSLSFAHIAKTEGDNDDCYVEISTDGGITFDQLPESAYYGLGNYFVPLYGNPEGPCFNEDSYTAWGTGSQTPDNTWWRNETFDLSSYAGNDNVMIRFRLSSNQYTHRAGWYIDDIVIDTYHGTEISVNPASIEVTIPQGSTTIEQLTIENMDDFPIGYSAVVVNYTDAISTIYSENFDAGLAVDWTVIDGGNTTGPGAMWEWINATVYGSSLDGTNFMKVQRTYPNIDEEELISPVIDATGYATVYLEFDHYWQNGGVDDYFVVSIFDGTNWIPIYQYVPGNYNNIGGWSNPAHEKFDITQYANTDFQVNFYYNGTSYSRWALDNFSVTGSDIPLDWLTLNGEFSTDGLLFETESDIVDVEFYASPFAPVGSWYVDVEVTSNDPVNPVIIVPCTMNVIPATPGFIISGTITYSNVAMTPMSGCTVDLYDNADAFVTSTTTDASGYYEFTGLADGDYSMQTSVTKAKGGITTADGIITGRMAAGIGGPYSAIQFLAGDVNASGGVTTVDAILVKRRAAALPSTWAAPDYVFETPSVIVNGADETLNYKSLCSGDINGSFTPPL